MLSAVCQKSHEQCYSNPRNKPFRVTLSFSIYNKFIQHLVQCSIHYSCFVECLRFLLERQIVVVFDQYICCTIFISICFLFVSRLGVRKYVPSGLFFLFHLPPKLHYSNGHNCYHLLTSLSKQGEKKICTWLVLVDGLKEIEIYSTAETLLHRFRCNCLSAFAFTEQSFSISTILVFF